MLDADGDPKHTVFNHCSLYHFRLIRYFVFESCVANRQTGTDSGENITSKDDANMMA